jgi:hypothetical protein
MWTSRAPAICRVPTADLRQVDAAAHRTQRQVVAQLLGHLDAQVVLGLRGGAADVRRQDHVVELPQRRLEDRAFDVGSVGKTSIAAPRKRCAPSAIVQARRGRPHARAPG